MAAIKFDITGDNSHFIKSMNEVQASVRQTSAVLSELGKNQFNMNGAVQQIVSLTRAIEDQEAALRRRQEKISQLMDDSIAARSNEDFAKFEAIQKLIDQESKEYEKITAEVQKYKEALNELKVLNDLMDGQKAPMLFNTQAEYDRIEALRTEIDKLKSDIANFDGSDADLQGLKNNLSGLEEELKSSEVAAAKNAQSLGQAGEMAAAASTRYYELTNAIRDQQAAIGLLTVQTNQAKAAYDAIKNSGDPVAVDEARVKWQLYSDKLQSAKMELINLQTEQKNLQETMHHLGDSMSAEGDKIIGIFKGIAAAAGISFGIGQAKDFMNQVVNMRAYFQDIESSMKVFLGSAEKGTEFTEKLKDAAYYNMFEFKDLALASQSMIAYGHDIDTIIPRLQQLSDIAVGTQGSIMELVDSYNRAKATGVVDGNAVRSWAVKGVMIKDVLREMGEQATGTAVTFEQLNKVLDHVTGEGGMFHNLQLDMMENISAEIGQFEDNFALMLNDIGERFQDEIVSGIKFGSEIIDNYEKVGQVLMNAVGAYGAYKTALAAVSAAHKVEVFWTTASTTATRINEAAKLGTVPATTTATVAWNTLTASVAANTKSVIANTAAWLTNPYVLIGAAVAGVTFAVWKLVTAEDAETAARRRANEQMEEFKSQLEDRKNRINSYINVLHDSTASEAQQIEAWDALKQEAPSLVEGYSRAEFAAKSMDETLKEVSKDSDKFKLENARQEVEKWRAEVEEATSLANQKGGGGLLEKFSNLIHKDDLKEAQEGLRIAQETLEKLEGYQEEASKTTLGSLDYKQLFSGYKDAAEDINDTPIEPKVVEDSLKEAIGWANGLQTTLLSIDLDKIEVDVDREQIEEAQGAALTAIDDLKKLDSEVADPEVKKEQIETAIEKVRTAISRLEDLNGTNAFPKVESSSIDNAISKLKSAWNWLQKLLGNKEEGNTPQGSDKPTKKSTKKDYKAEIQKRINEATSDAEVEAILTEVNTAIKNAKYGSVDRKYYKGLQDQLNKKKKENAFSSGKGGNKNATKEEAERQAKEKQQAWKHQEEMKKLEDDAARAREDASIAAIQSQAQRERAEREAQHNRTIADLKRQEDDIYKKIYQDRNTAYDTANKGKKNATPYELTEEGSKGWQSDESKVAIKASLSTDELNYFKEKVSEILSGIAVEETKYTREQIEREQQLIASHQSYTDAKIAIDKKYGEDVKAINAAIADAEARGDENTVEALKRSLSEIEKDRAKAQADLSLKQLQENPEYIRAFEDLDNTSTETLEHLIKMFEDAKIAAGRSLDPKDLKEYTDAIQQMKDKVFDRDKTKGLIESTNKLRAAQTKLKTAEDNLNKVRNNEQKQVSVVMNANGELEAKYMSLEEAEKQYLEALDDENKARTEYKKRITETCDAVDELADAISNLGSVIGGQAGEILGLVGDISMFVTSSIKSVQSMAEMGSDAIGTIEKASVILGIISAAFQIGQKIFSLFGESEEEKQKREEKIKGIEKLAFTVSNYRHELLLAKQAEDNWFSSTGLKSLSDQWQSSTSAIKDYREAVKKANEEYIKGVTLVEYQGKKGIFDGRTALSASKEAADFLIKGLDGHYQLLSTFVKDVYDTTLFDEGGILNTTVVDQLLRDYGDRLYKNAQDWLTDMSELVKEYKQFQETLKQYISELYSPFSDNMVDALWEWYENGTDVLKSFKENARGTFQSVAKEMMKQLVNNAMFDELKEKMTAAYEAYAISDEKDEAKRLLTLTESLNTALSEFEATAETKAASLQNTMERIMKVSEDVFGKGFAKSFDDMRSTIKDTLTDLEGSFGDFAKVMKEKFFNALVENTVMTEAFDEIINDAAEKFDAVTKDTTLSDTERAHQQEEILNGLQEEYAIREQIVKSIAQATGYALEQEIAASSFANIGDDLLSVLQDTSKSVEDWKDEIVKTMTNDLVKELVYSEEYKQKMREFQEQYVAIMSDTTLSTEDKQAQIDALAEIIAAYANATAESVKDIVKANETLESSFGDLHDSFMTAILDIENGAENLSKKLHETLVQDIIDKEIFGSEIKDLEISVRMDDGSLGTVKQSFADFEAYQKDWTKRYLAALKAGDTDLMRILVTEMDEREEQMAKAAETYVKELQDAAKDTTFTGMGDSFLSALMDTNKTAEDWAQDIGKTMAKKIFEGMMAENTLLQGVQDVWDKVVKEATSIGENGNKKIDWEKVYKSKELREVSESTKEEFNGLQKAWEVVCDALGVKLDTKDLPLSDLGSTIIDALTNTEEDVEKAAEDFGKNVALKLMNEMLTELLDQRYAERIKEIREHWQKTLAGEEGYTWQSVRDEITGLANDIQNLDDTDPITNLTTGIKELTKETEQADETFKSMGDSLVSTLMDMSKTADDLSKVIGRTMAENIIKEMVTPSMLQPLLNNLQDVFDGVMKKAVTKDEEGNTVYNWSAILGSDELQNAIQSITDQFPEAQESVKKIMELFGLDTSNYKYSGFSNPGDGILDSLKSAEGSLRSWSEDMGKTMAEDMAKAYVDATWGDEIDKLNERWQKALEIKEPGAREAELKAIREELEALYKVMENDTTLKNLTDQFKELVDTPLDNMRSTFLSDLMDIERGINDFANDVNKILTETFIDEFVLGDAFDAQLEEWKKKYREISNAGYSEEQRAAEMRKLQDAIVAYENGAKEQAQGIFDLMHYGEYKDQDATMNMADKATYDQFETYLGIAVSQQITAEHQLSIQQQILATLQSMAGISSPTNDNLLAQVAIVNSHLQMIHNYNKRMCDEIVLHLGSMDSKLSNLKNL